MKKLLITVLIIIILFVGFTLFFGKSDSVIIEDV